MPTPPRSRSALAAIALACVIDHAQSSESYRLNWIGDYQTGTWDSDAAENIAYDPSTQHVFVASAETGIVKVVGIRDPTRMSEVGTLNVKANLAAYCQLSDCLYEQMDFGGQHNPCGYATMVKVNVAYGQLDVAAGVAYGANGNYSMPSYVVDGGSSTSWSVDPTITSMGACQTQCAQTVGCSFFSYEFEYKPHMGISVHECFMKAQYTASQVPSGLTIEKCDHYTIWENGGADWDYHYNDATWVGGAGPAACGKFQADSVQSVAVVSVPGSTGKYVVAASPSSYHFGNGYLSIYDAATLNYVGCAEAGIKPEGITSNSQGKVACINEGSMEIQECGSGQVGRNACQSGDKFVVRYGRHYSLDQHGSMTMCQLTPAGSTVTIACQTHVPNATTFMPASTSTGHPGFLTPQQYRMLNLRLYGPSADSVAYDLEPEGGDFTDDGNYLIVNLQDNNGYMIFDVAQNKYVSMAGYGYKTMTMDASDKDDKINIKSSWGTSAPYTQSFGMYTPDVVKEFSVGGTHYVITANEGDTRDGKDLIGISGDFEGEETRSKDAPLTCTNGCSGSAELGRILTTTFLPSDYAAHSCGTQLCQAWQLDDASKSSWQGVFYRADYGGRDNIYDQTSHQDCGFAPMVAMFVDRLNKTGEVAMRPDTGGFPWGRARSSSTGKTITHAHDFPDWFSGTTGEDASITGPVGCMVKCRGVSGADHWSYEFENGYHECFCKGTHTDADHCNLYHTWTQHWSNGNPWGQHWEGYSGATTFTAPAPYTTERYTASQTLHAGHGVMGGHTSVGGRSFSIWSWNGQPGSNMVQVYDSGSEFETKQAQINNGLCDGCTDAANKDTCKNRCGFNSDDWPPKMDDRSDDKGPEPECVDIGVMADGTRLAFIGLERTGGIMTYDISTPANSVFQDFLNVRNWRVGETVNNDEIAKNLNDGPESLVFIDAAKSPIGRELLLAATPLAGRVSAYTIEKGPLRGNDGSCATTAGCPYLSTATCSNAGCGSGLYRGTDGHSTTNVCSICLGTACTSLGCTSPPPPPPNSTAEQPGPLASSSGDDSDDLPGWGVAVFVILGLMSLAFCVIVALLICKEKQGSPVFMAFPAQQSAKPTSATTVSSASSSADDKL